jgi:saccharopine dehydrogenase-like NADP-dependent oxidoreductase
LSSSSAPERGHRAIERLKRLSTDRGRFALVVTARAGDRTMSMSLASRHQANATAAGAAEFARMLAAREVQQPGVWLPEQIIPPEPFFRALAERGWQPELEERELGA